MGAQISRGRPFLFLDTVANLISLPVKVLFLNFRVDSHHISEEVERFVTEFVEQHELDDVRVRINEYAPLSELLRVFRNRRVNILLRVLFGLQYWFAYLLNIGRLFGGDHYSPFSNTVNLYSDHPAIALHEMGHALDFKRRRYPGIYALIRLLPFVALYQEFKASEYAVRFLREHRYFEEEIGAYRILYPAYSTYLFGAYVDLLPSPVVVVLFLPFIIVGHIIGNIHAAIVISSVRGKEELVSGMVGEYRKETSSLETFFSPGTEAGRKRLGALIGFVAGLFFLGIGSIPGAICGYFVAKIFFKPKTIAEAHRHPVDRAGSGLPPGETEPVSDELEIAS